jgi:hypothetical protein
MVRSVAITKDSKAGSEVISVRIPSDEVERLQAMATESGDSVSGLVRRAVTMMLEGGNVWVPSVDRFSSSARTTTVRHNYSSSSTEGVMIPDSPPTTVQGMGSSSTT